MSKLAAICAKLKEDAVSAVDNQNNHSSDSATAQSLPLFPPPPQESETTGDDETSRQSPVGGSGAVFPSTVDSLPASPMTEAVDNSIGVLKRKSIMPISSAAGASRRKRHRPAAVEQESVIGGNSEANEQGQDGDDDQSVNGSEHSLHIDLNDEKPSNSKGTIGDARRSPFQQYSDQSEPSASQANPGLLQALGLTGLSSALSHQAMGNIMASQSLAALAQQASSVRSVGEMSTSHRAASPASLSGDSLNDSHGRNSLSDKIDGKAKKVLDYSRYMARYSNSDACGSSYCRGMNYREHFHCMDCHSRIFVKKEEMIRHYKWHKKREDSLQHGFMRYSPFDDCSVKFGPCAHNKKQTHYHCIQTGCNKVYVSTSDVQMHANYHRKASAIIMEGFQRFRATEDCGTPSCDFYSQRTTHFHCRRQNCNFTFKNKADMEKHKTYHQKDEILAKDGFKKYMKYEHCPYQGCAYSKLSNHIHCMRPGCQYVLHSTSQLYPHKRKHEKRDPELILSTNPPVSIAPKTPPMSLNGTPPSSSKAPPSVTIAPPTLTAAPGVVYSPGISAEMAASALETSDSSVNAAMKSSTAASDLLSTVARLSQGLMPLVKTEKLGEDKIPPTNPFIPAAKGKQPPALLQSCTMTGSQTKVPQKSMTADNDRPSTISGYEGDTGSDGNSDSANEQTFDKSLNLAPGSTLKPAAMNWKTERSNRLSDQAKSMMGHFKIGSGDSTAVNSRASHPSYGVERTELWRKYLTRYTANDPCNPRCWLLYKDHYHCNVDRCFNAFKSKDGVRDHARLHDNQEKISEQLYSGYAENEDCTVSDCEMNKKARHYHCKWISCTKVITNDDDIFARLDHFQEHELSARISHTHSRRSSAAAVSSKAALKKRGRPPKTPQAVFAMQHINDDISYGGEDRQIKMQKILPSDKNMNYETYDSSKQCPDELCIFKQEKHYHCTSERCHHVTNRPDVINLHSINFHKYITIPENYAYFDRNVNCRGVHCSNNRNSCHYHCLRPGCEHSFIRHTTVSQHDKRHADDWRSKPQLTANQQHRQGVPSDRKLSQASPSAQPGGAGLVSPPIDPAILSVLASQLSQIQGVKGQMAAQDQPSPHSPTRSSDAAAVAASKTVKAAGTFFPQTGKPDDCMSTDVADDSSNTSSLVEGDSAPSRLPATQATLPHAAQLPSDQNQNSQQQASVMINLLTQMLLLQQKATQAQIASQHEQATPKSQPTIDNDTWQKMLGRMYASPQVPCGNTFCKKKQLEHFHCLECGVAFNTTHEARLKAHIMKHSRYSSGNAQMNWSRTGGHTSSDRPVQGRTSSVSANHETSTPGRPQPHPQHDTLRLLEALTKQQQSQAPTGQGETTSAQVVAPDSSTEKHQSSQSQSAQQQQAGNSIQDMMMRALQLQVITNKDDSSNTTPNTVSNHTVGVAGLSCERQDSADLEQDTEISDSDEEDDGEIIPDMYRKLSKAKDCGYTKCIHSRVSSHYHCLRDECTYSVIETSRLAQHTQRHEKLDRIMGDDFRLYKQQSDCGRADCEFTNKASHFHCLLCPYICTDANRILPHRKNHGAVVPSISQTGNMVATASHAV